MKTIKRLALFIMFGLLTACSTDGTGTTNSNNTNPSAPSVPTTDCKCGFRVVKTDTQPNPDVVIYDHTDIMYVQNVPTWYAQNGVDIQMNSIQCGHKDSFSQMGSNYIKVDIYRDCINY